MLEISSRQSSISESSPSTNSSTVTITEYLSIQYHFAKFCPVLYKIGVSIPESFKFQARLMEYPKEYKDPESVILPAFLEGYNKERPFSEEQKRMYFYAVLHHHKFEIMFLSNYLF